MIDHLVYATPDLEGTAEELAGRLGVALSPGGRHVGVGTRNVLADLGGGAYLEVIGPDPDQPEPPRPRPFGIDALSEPRLLTWAVRVRGIDAVVERARAAGHDPGPVAALSRRTPEGTLLEWTLTSPPADGGGVVPFVIDWGDARHPSESAARGLRLASLRAEHPDPDRVRAAVAALGERLDVEAGPEPALEATLDTPHGAIVLR